MRGRSPLQSLAASPTMVGAVTTLIVIVAVFLAYNANNGLPFVPTYRVSVEVPNAARLTDNNEVRIGGHRVGVVESIEPVLTEESQTTAGGDPATAAQIANDQGVVAARLNLKLDKTVGPLPKDSIFRVRYRSSFGLKYLEIVRGTGENAPEGFTFDGTDDGSECTLPVDLASFDTQIDESAKNGCFQSQTEFDDINNTFDSETRVNSRVNLDEFGNAFAARGTSLNQAIGEFEPLFTNLRPVTEVLLDPETRFNRFFPELGDAAEIVAPVAEEQAELFTNMAVAFGAISEDPEALKASISEGPPTLETGIETLPRQRPFLQDFTTLTRELRPGVSDLRATLPVLNSALDKGTPVLRDTPPMNADLERVFAELKQLVEQPSTRVTLQRLEDTFDEARPLAEHVAPAQTVCNYWNYWFTYLTEHITERDQTGYLQRVVIVGYPSGQNRVGTNAPIGVPPGSPPGTFTVPGETSAGLDGYAGIQANGRDGLEKDPVNGDEPGGGTFRPYENPILHGHPYAPAGQDGDRDCQSGQTGYPLGDLRPPGQRKSNPAFGVYDIPGSRGPTTLYYKRNGDRVLKNTIVESREP